MDLRQFVSASLQQIILGVKDAQRCANEENAQVNPSNLRWSNPALRLKYLDNGNLVKDVCFDVAVTVTEGSEAKGGASLSVWSIGIGGHEQSNSANTSISRIRFAVPIALPVPDRQD